jgi:hypothetical protein
VEAKKKKTGKIGKKNETKKIRGKNGHNTVLRKIMVFSRY